MYKEFKENQFYPTPDEIIGKMIAPFIGSVRKYGINGYDTEGIADISTILDPSAGFGNILDYCYKIMEDCRPCPKLYAIEIDINLQNILRKKHHTLIGEDFLDYKNSMGLQFDLILMNPPFQSGAEHLLHAWEILDGGDIVCLLNAETILNSHTAERQLLAKIIEDNGTLELLGPVFKNADNPTDVEIALIRLHKEEREPLFEFKFESKGTLKDLDLSDENLANALATTDIVGNMQLRFQMAQEAYVDIARGFAKFNFANQDLTPSHWEDKIDEGAPAGKYQDFSMHLNAGMWTHVINKLGCDKLMTHRIREDFARFIKEQGYLEFNKKNIGNLITMLFENKNTILEKAIVDVFDMFTSYDKENRLYVEGWKTNDSWKVNQKVILPNWLKWGLWDKPADIRKYGSELKTNYSYHSQYSDIDKVMCYITGTPYEQCYTLYASLTKTLEKLGKVYSGALSLNSGMSTFFEYKYFKKGTLHIEFRDKHLWQEFNIRATQGKAWLPKAEWETYQKSKKRQEEPKQETLQLETLFS